MKKLLFAALAAQALVFTACGDDSSSSGTSMSDSASLIVDEARQMLVMTPDAYSEDGCVLESGAPVWKSTVHQHEPDSFKYEFHGDTLYLSEIEGEYVYDARLFVGGKAGNLYSTWTFTSCRYDEEEGIRCSEEDARYYEMEYTFSAGRVTAKAEYHYDKYLAEKKKNSYMDSYFTYQLYKKLHNRFNDRVYIREITYNDPEEVQSAIDDYAVQVLEKNNNGGKFTMGGKTYTLKVNKVEERLVVTKHRGAEELEANIEVSDGTTTCVAEYLRTMLQKGQCNVENADYLQFETEVDGNGAEYQYGYGFTKNNEVDFNNCLFEIALPQQEEDVTPFYKKAEKSKRDSESDTFRMYREMLKYANN